MYHHPPRIAGRWAGRSPAIGALSAAAALGWNNDYALAATSAFSGAATLGIAPPRQLAASQGAFSGAATLSPANKATIARATINFAAAGLVSLLYGPRVYPMAAAFSGTAALASPPVLVGASFSSLGASARFAASTVELQRVSAAFSGAGALAGGATQVMASGAALRGAGVVNAYSNLAIASAAACFTSQGEWALREGYIAVPHDNRGSWVAGGLFAAAAIQHSRVFPAYFPLGRGRIVTSRPVRMKRVV